MDGKINSLGRLKMTSRPSAIMTPQFDVGRCVPAPRKLKLASTMIERDTTTGRYDEQRRRDVWKDVPEQRARFGVADSTGRHHVAKVSLTEHSGT